MTPTPEVQQRLRRYLLGDLDNAEREGIEQDLLTSDERFEELLFVEDEITDDYLAQRLSPDERRRFDTYFLKPFEHQEKLRFSRALHRAARTHNSGKEDLRPAQTWHLNRFIYTAAAVMVVAVIVGSVIWFNYRGRSNPTTFATIQLNPSETTRSDDMIPPPLVKLPLREDAVRVVMNLPKDAPRAERYRAALETDFGKKTFIEPSAQDNNSVTVVLLSADLKRGQYAMSLYAVDSNGGSQRLRGSYRFNVQ